MEAVFAIVGFLVIFPLFWGGTVALISVLSGWHRLAKRFAVAEFSGTSLGSVASARIGIARYRGVLKVGWSERGLHLAVMVLFRPLHPPLCIPWSEISARSRSTFLMFSWDTLQVQGVSIALSSNLLAAIEQRLPALR